MDTGKQKILFCLFGEKPKFFEAQCEWDEAIQVILWEAEADLTDSEDLDALSLTLVDTKNIGANYHFCQAFQKIFGM